MERAKGTSPELACESLQRSSPCHSNARTRIRPSPNSRRPCMMRHRAAVSFAKLQVLSGCQPRFKGSCGTGTSRNQHMPPGTFVDPSWAAEWVRYPVCDWRLGVSSAIQGGPCAARLYRCPSRSLHTAWKGSRPRIVPGTTISSSSGCCRTAHETGRMARLHIPSTSDSNNMHSCEREMQRMPVYAKWLLLVRWYWDEQMTWR